MSATQISPRLGRRDSNEKEIVAALRKIGADVLCVNTPTDLIVGYRNSTFLLEVKSAKGKMRSNRQAAWWDMPWNGHRALVRTVEEALKAIGAM